LGNWVRITVADTGIGIPPENMSHIFEPFFTTKPVGQGTGLGLAQVYGIIKQHDGFIIPRSQPGEGTAFEIYLPSLASPGQSKSQTESRVGLNGEGQTILLVEDDLATRTALQTLLKTYGFRVLMASNGVEALSILEYETSRVVLVISDIVMPKMGGMEMYNHIRQRWPTIKVLFMTGHPLDSANQAMLEAGQVHWLQKPFAIQEFSQTIDNLLNAI
jgi:CheY-like chemotaxis protein